MNISDVYILHEAASDAAFLVESGDVVNLVLNQWDNIVGSTGSMGTGVAIASAGAAGLAYTYNTLFGKDRSERQSRRRALIAALIGSGIFLGAMGAGVGVLGAGAIGAGKVGTIMLYKLGISGIVIPIVKHLTKKDESEYVTAYTCRHHILQAALELKEKGVVSDITEHPKEVRFKFNGKPIKVGFNSFGYEVTSKSTIKSDPLFNVKYNDFIKGLAVNMGYAVKGVQA